MISDRTGELLGAVYLRDRVVLHAIDERLARDWERVRALHPGDPRISGQDAEETAFIVAFDDDRDPGATYLFDRATGDARAALPLAALARPGHPRPDAAGDDRPRATAWRCTAT